MKKIYTISEIKAILDTDTAADTLNDCFAADGESLNLTVEIDGHSEISASIAQKHNADTDELYAEWEAATPVLLDEIRAKLVELDG